MINLANISSIYFLGIGGIGMSALARYFNKKGVDVSGYDKTPSPLTNELKKEGITITFQDEVNTLNENADLVIYTPAIPKNSTQLNWYKTKGFEVYKRSEVLGAITQRQFCIAVAGSHGKTTVSSMIAHILNEAGGCTAFLGGIATNFNSNYINTSDKYVVVEADEYDRSFMTLSPNITVVTAIDSDHLEIYGSLENIEKEFIEFINKTEKDGSLYLNENYLHIAYGLGTNFLQYSYGHKENNDIQLKNFSVKNGQFVFDVLYKIEEINGIKANFGGIHNLENATAAIAVCKQLGVSNETIKNAMLTFKGIKRRFDKQVDNEQMIYIDDYAHHPQEIKALLQSVKYLYPNKFIAVVFQPHLYSRTQNLGEDFAQELSVADQVILLPIYPAREEPIEGVSSTLILDKLTSKTKQIVQKEELLNVLKTIPRGSVVLTVGAGDIDRFVQAIKTLYSNE